MRPARLIQTVLLVLFTAVGLLATFAVAADWLRGLDTWFWQESSCTIEESGAVARPEYGDAEFRVSYRYRFRGDSYLGDALSHDYSGSEELSEAQILASRYQPGDVLRCWVDPEEPERSYLRRSDLWQGLWVLVPLLFVAVGGGALWLIYGFRAGGHDDVQEAPGRLPEKAKAGFGAGIMIVLFGAFFLFGVGFLLPFFVRPALQVVEARSWTELPCEVVSSKVRTHPGDDGATYSVAVLFRYEVDGREYRSDRFQFMGGSSSGYERKAEIVAAMPPGTSTACYVNPEDPFEAVIERGFTSDYLFGLIPLIFALIGLGGLAFAIHAMRSAKRDAAAPSWQLATSPEHSGSFGWSSSEPEPAESSSTGPLVLEPAMGAVGKLGCALIIALLWNGFISIFVWQLWLSWKAGNPEWFPIIILTPFVLIGLLMLVSIPHSILALLNPKPRVQLTPGALRVGEPAHLEWTFRGFSSRIRRLEIWLEATETKTRVGSSGGGVQTRPLDTPPIVVLERGREQPIEYGHIDFTVPGGTPPSSEGATATHWKLRLEGDIAYWPDVNESYVVQVLPPRGSGHGR